MKKNKLILSVLAIAFAMSLASCSNENSSNDNNQNNNSGQNSDDNNNNNNNDNNDKEDENPFYRLVLEPNEEFLKSQKSKIQKVNGRTSEVIDYVFSIPEDRIKVSNYNDLLIGEDPFLLTPIAVEVDGEKEGKSLTKEETKSLFSPITEFSQSGYGNEGIVKNLYNVSQVNTCYTLSQTKDGAMQSKYYNVSVTIEDTEAPVFSQNYTALIPFTLNKDAIISSIEESIRMFVSDNNSATELTITLKDEPILTGLTNLNREQVIHFDATDSDGNKIENQEFKYKLVDNLNYFETIDQETVNTVSYKNAQADYVAQNYELYKGIYSYKILNEDELVFSNENADNIKEIKTVINKEQTIKYGIYEDNQLIGEFNYKFKMIDDVAPYMVWADDGSVITVNRLNKLTAEHDNDLNARFQKAEILTLQALYDEFQSVVYAKDEICQNSKIIMTIYHVPNGSIGANFKVFDGSLYSKVVILEYIPFTNPKYDVCAKNYVIGEYDENGLIK